MKALQVVLLSSLVFLFSMNIVFAEDYMTKEELKTACRNGIKLSYSIGEANPYSPSTCNDFIREIKAIYLKTGKKWNNGTEFSLKVMLDSCHCGQEDKVTGNYSLPILLQTMDYIIDTQWSKFY